MEYRDRAVKLNVYQKYIKVLLNKKIEDPKYMDFKLFLAIFLETLKSKRFRNVNNITRYKTAAIGVLESIFTVASSAGRLMKYA